MPLSRAILDAASAPSANAKCPEGKTADMLAIEAKQAAARAWADVKTAIAIRDKFRCRLCGKKCRYGDPLPTRADAHHIIFASAGGPDESWNLVHLCRACHDLVHVVKRFFLSGNADDTDQMGHGLVKVEKQVESGFVVVGFI